MRSDFLEQIATLDVVCLAGGVGGAKLAEGLAQVVPPERLTVIVNTGDDFQHLGLTVCPDLDTVLYTLGGVANPETGWGRVGESWKTIKETGRLGGAAWFKLGDLDLATHLVRSQLLAEGQTLTAVTRHLCIHFDIQVQLLPMSDQPAPTMIASEEELLPFQIWFVRERWQPAVREVCLPQDVRATPQVMHALEYADIVVLAPSNPFVSIDPILHAYPIREMIMDLPRAVVAVSPIIGGKAVKGPAAKMMAELGMSASSKSVARYYGELIDGFIYDQQDAGQCDNLACSTLISDTLMVDAKSRVRLATELLQFALSIAE